MAARALPALVLAVLACLAVLAPATAASAPVVQSGDGPRPLDAGGTYCAADRLQVRADDPLADGTTYDVRRVADGDAGPVVRQVRFDDHATATVNATGLNGTYALFDGDGNPVAVDGGVAARNASLAAARWRVRDRGVVAGFADGSVAGTHWPEEATLQVRHCAGGGPVVVDSASLNASTLARMVDGTATGDGVRVPVPADGGVNVSVPWGVVGEHELAVRPADGGPAARAGFEVVVAEPPSVFFDAPAGIFRADAGGAANVTLARTGGGPALEPVLAVTGPDGRERLRVRVEAAEAGEDLAVRIDVGALAAGAPNGSVTAGGDDVATVLSAAPEQGFGPGDYRLGVAVRGEEFDVAAMRVADPNATPTAGRTTTAAATTAPAGTTTTDAAMTTGTAARSTATTPASTVSGGQPGFGRALALLALAALAALSVGRRS